MNIDYLFSDDNEITDGDDYWAKNLIYSVDPEFTIISPEISYRVIFNLCQFIMNMDNNRFKDKNCI